MSYKLQIIICLKRENSTAYLIRVIVLVIVHGSNQLVTCIAYMAYVYDMLDAWQNVLVEMQYEKVK